MSHFHERLTIRHALCDTLSRFAVDTSLQHYYAFYRKCEMILYEHELLLTERKVIDDRK